MIIGISGKAGSGKDTVADFLVKERGLVKVALADPLKRICKDVFDFTDEQLWGPSADRNKPDLRYPRGFHLTCGCLATHINKRCEGPVKWWIYGIRTYCENHANDLEWYRDQLFAQPEPPLEYLTPRHALQQLGTNWGRDCYENTWVEYALHVAKELLEGGYVYSSKRGLESEYGHPQSPQFPYSGVVIPDVRFLNEIDGLRAAGAKIIKVKREGHGLQGPAGKHASETEQDAVPDDSFDYVLQNEGTLEDLHLKTLRVFDAIVRDSGAEKRAEDFKNLLLELGAEKDCPVSEDLPLTYSGQGEVPDIPLFRQSTVFKDARRLFLRREEDIKSGRLTEYDPKQDNSLPPFKRSKEK